MNKKYKITTLLVIGMCFFITMMLADVFLLQKNQLKNRDKKVFAADYEKESTSEKQEEIFTSVLLNLEDITDTKDIDSEEFVNFRMRAVLEDKTIDDTYTNNEEQNNTDNEQTTEVASDANEGISLASSEDEMEIGLLSLDTEETPEEVEEVEEVVTFDKVIANVNESLNIRKEASSDSEVVGKLNKNAYAKIVERGEEWTKISSGNVTGYVNNDYLYFDQEAIDQATKLAAFKVKITAGKVNIRSEASTDSEVLGEAKQDETYVLKSDLSTPGWEAIQYGETGVAYITSEFTEEIFDLDKAVSKEAEEKAKKAAEVSKSLENAKKYKPETTNRAAIKATDEEIYLVATVVAMEALGESYEGQLAVANVIVNRLLSGHWGNTIEDVIYAPGQFSGANSGRVEKFKSKVTESCKRAAVEALAGNNNIGNYMSFIMKSSAKYSSYSKYYVLGCHVFYTR